MRIQNNVTAMNTHRMYTINNDAVAASAKKLSSGYRINSAADDAAGLAISEKMRSQIRGLNMATKNSQDAISLVQTAEGALQETQNMLQRMNELAVQAATGTNETLDRNALAKEFEQLKREINDIAEQTTFNNMKILDGSLSYTGYVRSSATAGVNATTESISNAPSLTPLKEVASTDAAAGSAQVDQAAGKVTVAGSAQLKDVKTSGTTAANQKIYEIDLGIEGVGTLKVDANNLGSTATAPADQLGGKLAAALNTLKGQSTITADSGKDTVTVGGVVFESVDAATAMQEQLKSGDYTAAWDGTNLTLTEKATTTTPPAAPDGKEGQGTLKIDNISITEIDYKAVEAAAGVEIAGTTAGDKASVTFKAAETNMADLTATGTKGEKYSFELKQGNNVVGSIEVTADGTKSIGQLINEKYGETNPIELNTSFASGEATATGKFNVAFDDTTDTISFTALDAGTTFGATGSANKITMTQAVSAPAEQTTGLNEAGTVAADAVDAAAASKTYDLKFPTGEEGEDGVLKNGQRLEIDGKTYTFTDKATPATGEFNSMQSLVDAINGNESGKVKAEIATGEDGSEQLKLSQAVKTEGADPANGEFTEYHTDANLDVKWTGPVGDGSKTTVEFDFAKMQVGDKVTINIGGTKGQDGKVTGGDNVTIEKKAGQSRADFMASVKDAIKGTGATWENDNRVDVRGNAIIASGTSMNVEMELAANGLEEKNEKTNAVRIQVGALEDEQLSISIDAMNTAGLGLDGVSLMAGWDGAVDTDDQDAAGAAITATRNAINKISDQRATLGAMQNRLDHKIANLKISAENLTASESRIRDVDMASEMTNFTKNQILSQAATAMLAQANSLPQNVLSLLG